MALINLELYEMAFDDLEKILEIDPKNKETLRLKEAIKDKVCSFWKLLCASFSSVF